MCCERLIMRALQFAIATANLASQIAFLFLATHRDGPSYIACAYASSSAATLLQCGFQYCLWNCSPIPPLAVKMIGTRPMLFLDLQPESDFRRMSRVRGQEYVRRGIS